MCVLTFSDEIKFHYKSSLGKKGSNVVYSFRLQSITAGVNYSAWSQAAVITEKSLEQELWRTVSPIQVSSEERMYSSQCSAGFSTLMPFQKS